MSSTKTSSSKEIEEIKDTNTENMDNHSIWYGRLKKNPKDAKLFKELLTDLSKRFLDEDGFNDILHCYWGKSIEELDDLIKSQNKREKKVNDKFTPENVAKPTNAKNLFTKDFVIECKTKANKFTLKGLSDAWNNLNETKKNTYIKAAEKEKTDYLEKYELAKRDAINNGSLAADKPKGPTTAFFRYLSDERESIKQMLLDDGETEDLNKKIPSKAGELWKVLPVKDKNEYELAYKTEKEKYSVLLEEWKSKETSRLKKLDGKTEDIKVEESGDKSATAGEVESIEPVPEKVSKAKTKKSSSVKTEVDTEDPQVKVEKTVKVKAEKAKKTEKKVNLTEDEDEDDD